MIETDCALILLASGLSTRFGHRNKLLARLGDKAVVNHVIEELAELKFSRRFVVLADDDNDLATTFKRSGYVIVFNDNPDQGQGRSLALGTSKCIEDGFETACVALADMPFISAAHVQQLIEALSASKVAMSCYDNRLMPPAVFAGESLKKLTFLSGEQGAKSILSDFDIISFPLSKMLAHDIDTPEDLILAQTYLKALT